MADAIRIDSRIQLLVEGNDPRNFFDAFISHLSLVDIQIQNFGSVSQLSDFLVMLTDARNFKTVQSIGIIRDAENSAASAFQSVQSSLERAGLPVPNRPETPVSGNPSVNVLILPGRGRQGMLETLLCETFVGSPEDACIDNFFQCIAVANLPPIKRPDKAEAWAYLTTKPDPHHSVGFAASKGYWGDLGQPAFSDIRDFLSSI